MNYSRGKASTSVNDALAAKPAANALAPSGPMSLPNRLSCVHERREIGAGTGMKGSESREDENHG